MAIYDINGNEVASGSGSITVQATDMANILSTGTTDISQISSLFPSTFVSKVIADYESFINDVDGDKHKVPMIVHTDQHGRLSTWQGTYTMNLLGQLCNWYKISKVINLGDTVSGNFTNNSSHLVDMVSNTIKYIPYQRQINVFGNHDALKRVNSANYYEETHENLNPYFINTDAQYFNNEGYFTVVDKQYGIKYVILSNFYWINNSATNVLTTNQTKFIIDEFSKNDGLDIILLSHVPLKTSTTETHLVDDSDTLYNESFFSNATVYTQFLALISARKKKTSGTITDSNSVIHNYDFSDCESELLMSLHGHTHFEAYQLLTNSIFEWAADWFPGPTFYFCYVDRNSMTFKRWKLDYEATTTDSFTADGSTTAYTLSDKPSAGGALSVTVGGSSTTAYTISDNTLTFTSAPSNGSAIEVTYYTDDVLEWDITTGTYIS